jgi:hypothetical protein
MARGFLSMKKEKKHPKMMFFRKKTSKHLEGIKKTHTFASLFKEST